MQNASYAKGLLETIRDRYPDPDQYPYRSWTYPQAFMLWGFIRAYQATGAAEYREYALRYCDQHVREDGGIDGFTGCSLDDVMPGSVLVWAYCETGEERYKKACHIIRGTFDDYPRNGNGGFWHGKDRPGEMWVDGVFMGLMFLTRYGRYIGNREYCYQETVRQLETVFACCEKDGSGLLYHAYSENPKTSWAHPVTGKSPEVWSEGLGWYALILTEALELLPPQYPGRERLLEQLDKLARALLRTQDKRSGLWYQVVDKCRWRGNWHDSSGSAMFLYCLLKAARRGWLQNDLYGEAIEKGFRGLKAKLRPDVEGHVDVWDACNGLCVQFDYADYVGYARSVNCQEAVAACLWAFVEKEMG